uniref:restriction endonuclease subunit S n=1 Tax=Algoriphagus sp. TaxID=1872435 RepID=UPI004047D790
MSWEIFKLKDITVNLDNKRKPLNESERSKISKKQLYPYLGANNIMGYVDEYLFDEEIICIAEDGGSWGENQKCCVFINEKCWVNNHAHVLKSNGKADLKYLMYYLNAKDLNSYITGSTRGKLTKSSLDSIGIPLPPLATQKRIAEILDAADALRRKDQELLKKYDELAQAIFIDMFGDPVKNEKGWRTKEIKHLLFLGEKISYGIVQPGDEQQNGVPVIRVGDFKLLGVSKNNIKMVDPSLEQKHKKTRLIGDEILIACVGSIGKIALADESLKGYNIVRATARVRIDQNILNRKYLAVLLSQPSIQNYFTSETRTVSQPTLNIKQIEETSILLPPIDLQNNFEQHYNTIYQAADAILINKSQVLFEGLIQKAFKGELVA